MITNQTPAAEMQKLLEEIERTLNNDETVAPRNLQQDMVTLLTYIRTLQKEHQEMQEAIKKAVKVIEEPNPAINDTIWASDGCTLVDLLVSSIKP
jgi:hypothetical protein